MCITSPWGSFCSFVSHLYQMRHNSSFTEYLSRGCTTWVSKGLPVLAVAEIRGHWLIQDLPPEFGSVLHQILCFYRVTS